MSDTLPPPPPRYSTRQRALGLVAIVVVLGVIAWGAYWLFYGRFFESTDDAYVGGDVVAITSREPGTILTSMPTTRNPCIADRWSSTSIPPMRSSACSRRKPISPRPCARRARCSPRPINRGRRFRRRAFSSRKPEQDYRRRAEASSDGSVSKEEVSHANDATAQAKAALTVAQTGLEQTLAQIQGTTIATNPDVLAAAAKLRNASLVLDHMQLFAPVDGVVAQRTVQVGEQVAPGTPLLAIVPLDNVWVDANFKEVQLTRMRVGQPVTLTADIYGGGVTYHGYVAGFRRAAVRPSRSCRRKMPRATGSRSCSACRCASGSIRNDLKAHPLRVSLSVNVTVDVRDSRARRLPRTPSRAPSRSKQSRMTGRAVNALIAKIIADNSGTIRAMSSSGAQRPQAAPLAGVARWRSRRLRSRWHVHAGARYDHRQCVAAHDRRQSRRERRPGHLGHHLVRRVERHRRAAHRLADGTLRRGAHCS
jgi:membrane fusion protein (multidrug efflux system)